MNDAYPDAWPEPTDKEKAVVELVGSPHDLYKVTEWCPTSGAIHMDDTREQVESVEDADVMTSHVKGTRKHTVMIDLDVPARLVPSTTPGHSHLYIDVEMNWPTYKALLEALSDAGVIEYGYLKASERFGATSLRLPWVEKTGDEPTKELTDDDLGKLVW